VLSSGLFLVVQAVEHKRKHLEEQHALPAPAGADGDVGTDSRDAKRRRVEDDALERDKDPDTILISSISDQYREYVQSAPSC
jgi:hypothetical protein